MTKHEFTNDIFLLISEVSSVDPELLFSNSDLLQYLNIKTKSANSGSKSRGSFGNLYAIYVLIEDYINNGYKDKQKDYSSYHGAKFSDLLKNMRSLPFGEKLQNHALNHRLNEEFKKYFPQDKAIPIIRDSETNCYWFNESLLKITIEEKTYNIANLVISIIDRYVHVKQSSFNDFFENIKRLKQVVESKDDNSESIDFIKSLLKQNVDARLFEIVSFAILKYYYFPKKVYFGEDLDKLRQENLTLYKTGRTNANDGGIDFVMKPLGRFFQVTETTDVKKHFLDIDKVHRYPVTFVVKSNLSVNDIKEQIANKAAETYKIKQVIEKYIQSIEEIINIEELHNRLNTVLETSHINFILDEIYLQSKVEFNIE